MDSILGNVTTFHFRICCYLCQGKITAQGKLLLQDTLMVQEHNPKAAKGDQQKFKERRVFLFEQIIIFSEEIEKKNNLSNPGYIYKNSLMVRLAVGRVQAMRFKSVHLPKCIDLLPFQFLEPNC